MIDRSSIGREFPAVQARVEADGVRAFARSIGETDPIYFDHDAAVARGYRGIPAPPTYAFCLKLNTVSPEHTLESLGVHAGSGQLLHAEQSFSYKQPICVGDELTFRERVADVYEKKGGSLIFIVLETIVSNSQGQEAQRIRHTEVLRVDA
ncbi:MAG: MaoC family dehydratase N-terminal domain-containing protein [Steroidobacteraceae bacterium]